MYFVIQSMRARMSVYDLIFLLGVLSSAVTLVCVAVRALRGRGSRALRLLRNYAIWVGVYLAVSVGLAAVERQRIIRLGDPWCFDDWCLTAQNVNRSTGGDQAVYKVDLLISSRARRVTQRAKGAWIYLIDEHGHRYAPDADPSAVPLDVLLQPGDSVSTSRVFHVPAQAHQLGLITGHGGAYCGPMNFLIIGHASCLFGKPPMIPIQ